MAQTFRIATSSKLDQFNVLGDKSKVTEQLFWQMVTSKVKEITEKQPEKFDETMETGIGMIPISMTIAEIYEKKTNKTYFCEWHGVRNIIDLLTNGMLYLADNLDEALKKLETRYG